MMGDRRTLNEEKLRQCYQFFERELMHWERLARKRLLITIEEFESKKAIMEAVHRVAAVAAIECGPVDVQNLQWNYGELSMAMEAYRQMDL